MADLAGGSFKTFPEFSKLTMADRDAYDALIKDYPPVSDISFAALMTWRNQLDSLSIAILNDNIVISYWMPGDDAYSGLSLVGTNMVDESLAIIFDHLREQGWPCKLVHVPDFVIANIQYPAMYSFSQEVQYEECILRISKYYPLANDAPHRQWKVKKFIEEHNASSVKVQSLDLSLLRNQELLLETTKRWVEQGVINRHVRLEIEALHTALANAGHLSLECVAIVLDNQLASFCVYQKTSRKEYVALSHLKLDQSIPRLFEYITYAYAQWFGEKGYVFANLENDWGLPHIQATRLVLGPDHYFRKFTLRPS